MTTIDEIKEIFKGRLIKNKNILLEENFKLLPDTVYILEEVGLPRNSSILSFTFYEHVQKLNERYIVIGKTFGKDNILIDILGNDNIVFDSGYTEPRYICKNVRTLLECIFEYETFVLDFLEFEKLGNYQSNKVRYADYLFKKIEVIDEGAVDYSKGYFWGSLIESIEFGI